jgi:glutathione S-transferase
MQPPEESKKRLGNGAAIRRGAGPVMIADLCDVRHVGALRRDASLLHLRAAPAGSSGKGKCAMYTLYYAPGTASFPVHLALLEIGAAHELKRVDLAGGEQNTPAYLALNPNAVVPTMLVDGKPVYESAALLMLLAERHPDKRLAPAPGTADRGRYLQWMLHFANVVQPAFRIWFSPEKYAGEGAATAKDIARQQIEGAFQRFDAFVAAHGPYALGADFGVLDIYATMLMRWSRNMPKPATSWPALAALAARVKARPAWAKLYEIEGLTEWA